jgi:hypothetical protein
MALNAMAVVDCAGSDRGIARLPFARGVDVVP